MSSIRNRIEKLERALNGGDRCLTCGISPGDELRIDRVVFAKDGEPTSPEFCPDCGARLRIDVQFNLGKLKEGRDQNDIIDGQSMEADERLLERNDTDDNEILP